MFILLVDFTFGYDRCNDLYKTCFSFQLLQTTFCHLNIGLKKSWRHSMLLKSPSNTEMSVFLLCLSHLCKPFAVLIWIDLFSYWTKLEILFKLPQWNWSLVARPYDVIWVGLILLEDHDHVFSISKCHNIFNINISVSLLLDTFVTSVMVVGLQIKNSLCNVQFTLNQSHDFLWIVGRFGM